jgi:capsular polysaccharide biosynthesis protein
MNIKPTKLDDDDIDLRAIILPLWKARWVILVVTLGAALVAFIVSFWILPGKYQASAYVFIGQPAVEFSKSSTDSGLTISPTLPDLNAVVHLATSPDLLDSVLQDPAVVTANGTKKIYLSDMIRMASAVSAGKDQLSLQITDTDPKRAALIANTWAIKVINLVNTTYGLNTVAHNLDTQVTKSLQNYTQAQVALEAALSKSKVDALNAQLVSSKADLGDVLASIIRTGRVLNDLIFFEQGLSGIPGESPLSLGDGLALTTLRQRALTVGTETFTVQIDSNSFTGFTVSKAMDSATQMAVGLQTQLTSLQGTQKDLEQKIPQLEKNLSNATAQLTQLTHQRDQSQLIYSDLYQTQQQVAIVLANSSKVANRSMDAVPPDKKSSPNVMLYTALVGLLGLMLVVVWVFLQNWWQDKETKSEGNNP